MRRPNADNNNNTSRNSNRNILPVKSLLSLHPDDDDGSVSRLTTSTYGNSKKGDKPAAAPSAVAATRQKAVTAAVQDDLELQNKRNVAWCASKSNS